MLSEKRSRIQKYVNYAPNYNIYFLKIGGSKYSKMLGGYLWVVGFLLHNFLCFLIFLHWAKILLCTKKCLKHWEYSSKCFQYPCLCLLRMRRKPNVQNTSKRVLAGYKFKFAQCITSSLQQLRRQSFFKWENAYSHIWQFLSWKKRSRHTNKNVFSEWNILFEGNSGNFSQLELKGSILCSIHIPAELPAYIWNSGKVLTK